MSTLLDAEMPTTLGKHTFGCILVGGPEGMTSGTVSGLGPLSLALLPCSAFWLPAFSAMPFYHDSPIWNQLSWTDFSKTTSKSKPFFLLSYSLSM